MICENMSICEWWRKGWIGFGEGKRDTWNLKKQNTKLGLAVENKREKWQEKRKEERTHYAIQRYCLESGRTDDQIVKMWRKGCCLLC